MSHRQCQCGVGAGANDQHVVRFGSRFGFANVDRHDVRTALLRGKQVPRGIRLARQVGCPKDDEAGMLAHVFFGVGLEHPGEAESECPQAPADHGWSPELAAVEICEAGEQLRVDARPVIGCEGAVAGPHANGGGILHAGDDAIERFVPCRAPECVAAAIADQRVEQAGGIADDFP